MSVIFVFLLYLSGTHGALDATSIGNRVQRIKARFQEKVSDTTEYFQNQLTVISETARRCSRVQHLWSMYVRGRCFTFVEEKLSKAKVRLHCAAGGGFMWRAAEDDFLALTSNYFIRDDDISKFLPNLYWIEGSTTAFKSFNPRRILGTTFWGTRPLPLSISLCVAVEGITNTFSAILKSCEEEFHSICYPDADTPPERAVITTCQPPTEITARRRQRDIYAELKDKRNFRLTSIPDWSVYTVSQRSCARQCRSQQPGCVINQYRESYTTCILLILKGWLRIRYELLLFCYHRPSRGTIHEVTT